MLFFVDPAWNRFDDYMQGLKTKSRTKVKHHAVRDFELRALSGDELAERCDELIALYKVYMNAPGFAWGRCMRGNCSPPKRSGAMILW